MTDELSALQVLTRLGGKRIDFHLESFRQSYEKEPLVIDQWFAVQGRRHHSGGVNAVRALTDREDYIRTNPNRVRSLLGAFGMGNHRLFHQAGGAGYHFMAEEILDMETRNPQVAARLLGMFEFWPKVDEGRQAILRDLLDEVSMKAKSDNLREIAQRLLVA